MEHLNYVQIPHMLIKLRYYIELPKLVMGNFVKAH